MILQRILPDLGMRMQYATCKVHHIYKDIGGAAQGLRTLSAEDQATWHG